MIPDLLWLLLAIVGLLFILMIAFGTGDLDIFDIPVFVFIGTMMFFSGIIGITGLFNSLDELLADIFPLACGAVIAVPVSFGYHRFIQGSDPEEQKREVIGKLARVVFPVSNNETGQISVSDPGTGSKIYFPALSGESEPVKYQKKLQVRITGFEGRTAIVVAEGTAVTKTEVIEHKRKITVKCAYCGQEKPVSAETCKNCGHDVQRCVVCKGEIVHGQEILYCPNCSNGAHSPHILEWIKMKGNCPACRENLVREDLVSMKKTGN